MDEPRLVTMSEMASELGVAYNTFRLFMFRLNRRFKVKVYASLASNMKKFDFNEIKTYWDTRYQYVLDTTASMDEEPDNE